MLSCDIDKAGYWYLLSPGTRKSPKAMALLQRTDQWLALLADYTTALEHALSARRSATTVD